jgi:hypothetical protein
MEVWTFPIVRRGLWVLAKRTRVWMLKLTTSTSWVVTLLTRWRFSFSLSKLPWLHLALLLGEMFYKLNCPSPTRKSPEATILILFGGMGYSFGRRKSLRSTKPISVGCWKKAWRLMILQRCTPVSMWPLVRPNCPANWEEWSYWEENVSCCLLI